MGVKYVNGKAVYTIDKGTNLNHEAKIDNSKIQNSKSRTKALTKEYKKTSQKALNTYKTKAKEKKKKKSAETAVKNKSGITGGYAQKAQAYRKSNPVKKKKKTQKKKDTSKNLTSNEALLLQNLSRTGSKKVVEQGVKSAKKTLRTSKAKTNDYKNLDKKIEKKKSKPSKTLTTNESLLVQNLTRTGTPDVVNKGLKGAEKTLRTSKAKTNEYKNLDKKVAKQDEKFLNSSPFAYGFMAGTSPIPLKETLEKQAGHKIDTSKAEKSVGYKAGYMTGLAAEYAATGGVARDAIQQSLKLGLKQAGKKAGKEVAKDAPKLTKLGEKVLSGATADMITGVPTNALEAGKEASKVKKGEKGKTFAKSLAANTAFDVGLGAVSEAAPAALKALKNRKAKEPKITLKERLNAVKEARAEVPKAEEVVTTEVSDIVKKAEARKIQQVAAEKIDTTAIDKAWGEINEAKAYIDDAKTQYKALREERITNLEDYIKNYEKKGSKRDFVPANNDYGQEYYIPQSYSLNDKWYSDFYKKNGRAPNKSEARALAEKLVDEGSSFKESEFYDADLAGLKETIDSEEKIYRSLAQSGDLSDAQLAQLSERFTDKELGKRVIDRAALEKDLGADVNKNKPKYKESTATANDVLPDSEKVSYQTETHKGREKAARERLGTDYEGEYNDLLKKDYYTSEDFATAGELLNREKNNYSRFIKLAKKAAEASSEAGQKLEAAKHIKENTVAGKVIEAERASQKRIKSLEKENPRKLEMTDKQAKETIEEIDKAVDEAVTDTIKELNSGKIAEKIVSQDGKEGINKVANHEEVKESVNKAVDEATNEVLKFINPENIIKKYELHSKNKVISQVEKKINNGSFKMTPELEKSFNIIVKDISDLVERKKTKPITTKEIENFVKSTFERQENTSNYEAVLQSAGNYLRKKYKNNASAMEAIDKLLEEVEYSSPYSSKRLGKTINEAMKDAQIDIQKLMKKSVAEKSDVKTDIINAISLRLKLANVRSEVIDMIADETSKVFDEKLNDAAQKYIFRRFYPKETDIKAKKAQLDDIIELINVGAYRVENEHISSNLEFYTHNKTIKVINEALKEAETDIKAVMKKSAKEKEGIKETIVESVTQRLEKAGVNGIDDTIAERVGAYVGEVYDKRLKEAARKYLYQRFAPKDLAKNKKNSTIENVMELINMGAYDDGQIVDLMRAKNNVPVLTPQQAKQITEYMEIYESVGDTREGREALARANKIIKNLEESTFADKFRSVQRIAMLSNPKTLLSRNAGGNILLMGAENIKDIPASLIDKAVSLKTGQRTTTGMTLSKLKSQGQGFARGAKEQVLDIKHGVDTAYARTHYEMPNKDVWNNKVMQKLDNFIGQALQLGDRPFYEAAYKSRKEELEKLIKKGKTMLTEEEIEADARHFALDRVFQADTSIAEAATKIRDALNGVGNNKILGNIVLPFTQTPSNILSKLVDYSPSGLLKAVKELSKTRKGTFDQKVFVDTLGRTFTGGGLIMLGYALAGKDILSVDLYAQSGKDAKVQKAYEKQGKQSYAIQLDNGTSFTIDWANPIGTLLILGAEAYNGGANEEDLVTSIYGGTVAATDAVFNQSFLQGLQSMFSSTDGSITEGLVNTLLSSTSQPLPAAIQQLTRVIDPVKRETYDENPLKKQLNVLMSKTPYLSTKLPAKKDVTGQDVEQFQGRSSLNKIFEAYLAPANITKREYNNVNDEAVKVYEETGEKGALLRIGDKSFSYDGASYKLKNAQEISRFQEVQGKYAYEQLGKLFNTSDYKGKSASEKAEAIRQVTLEAKEKAAEDYLIKHEGYTQTQLDFAKLTKTQRQNYKNTDLVKSAYIDYINTSSEYNEDGKGRLKQDEFKQYVRDSGISSSVAHQLWIAYGWSPKTNPY